MRLEWRPLQTTVALGESFDIELHAVSNTNDPIEMCGLQVILDWDAAILDGLAGVDACQASPCPPNTYRWSISGFPPAAINDSLADGDAYYWALACPTSDLPAATAIGLHIATFRFTAQGVGLGELRLQDQAAGSLTIVLDGNGSGMLADLGPPAQVRVIDCPDAVVSAIGSRYLSILPGAGDLPVAFSIKGDASNPDVECIDRWVQQTGLVNATPVSLLPSEWGTVFVNDSEIAPSTSYTVQVHCGLPQGLDLRSNAVTVNTWQWGDVTGDGESDQQDIAAVLDGANGNFQPGLIPEHMDVAPCVGDGVVDAGDVDQVFAAIFENAPFPCVVPCRPLPDLDTLLGLIDCLAGPGVPVQALCLAYDQNLDGGIDLMDLADFQVAPASEDLSGPGWLLSK